MFEFLIDFCAQVIDIFSDQPIAQLIGLGAFGVSIYNFLFCKDKKFIFYTMIASLIWGIHFQSLGLLSAAFINFVDVIKNAFALKYQKNKYIAGVFVVLYGIIGYFAYEGYISLIPTVNAILSTFLVFFVRGVYLNLGFIFVISLWMVYNLVGNSIGGVLTDITLLICCIAGVIRILKEEKKD